MNSVSRNKVLLTIIAILFVTNVAMLIFFLNQKPATAEAEKRIGFTDRLKHEVGFSAQQMSVFEPKKKVFRKRMNERFDEIKKTKQEFYYLMYDPSVSDSVLQSRAEIIGNQQKELDLQVIKHFKDIRTLCSPEQLPKYDSILPSIIHRMTERPAKK